MGFPRPTRAWAWGDNSAGQLGDGQYQDRRVPAQVNNVIGVTAIAEGLALVDDGTVWAWGRNQFGQVGDGTTVERRVPVQVQNLNGVTAIAAGGGHRLALKNDGTVWAWGGNDDGQLGDGTTEERHVAVRVQNLIGVTAIAAGPAHSLAVKNDGTLWAWGDNSFGTVGDGTNGGYRTTPVQIPNLIEVKSVAAGSQFSLAVKSDGTLWAWGSNESGQLGDGTAQDRSAPAQIQNLTGVTAIAGGYQFSLAVKSDGTVWAWGRNELGQLGDGTTQDRHLPVQVQNLSGVTAVSAGGFHGLAVKSNGTLWAWGINDHGQLGDGTGLERFLPVQVPDLALVTAVAASGWSSLAVAMQHVVDRSAQYGTPDADAPPTACVVPGLDVHDIAYRDTSGDLHDLWRDAQGRTGTADATKIAVGGAKTATGTPFFYVDTTRNTLILLYRDHDHGTVRSLYWSTGEVGADNLSGTAAAPNADGDPVGYYVPANDTHHIIYRTNDGNLHELNAVGVTPIQHGGNVTGAISAPEAAGDPTAFANAAGLNFVVYRSKDTGEILSVYWSEGPRGLDRLSVVAGTPPAAGEPFGYYTAYNDTVQIVYVAKNDGHIYELYSTANETIRGWDITPPNAPQPTGNLAAYYSAGTNTKHVFYRSDDQQLHEIWWVPGGGTPAHVNLTERFGAPPAADRPAAFTVEGPNTQHVAYRGTDNHIYELIW